MNYSEEEIKAIENLEQYIKEDEIYNGNRENLSDFDKFCIGHCADIKIVLGLLEKQQEEIENLKNINNLQSKDITKTVNYIFKLKTELEKKDKIIDVILKNYIELTIPTISKCQNLELKSCLLQKYNNGKFDNILNQTKQYFERKVKEGEKDE